MNREKYINEIICNVEDKKKRLQIEKELNDHIDDRIEYYTDAGYDYDYAENMALSKMGDPDELSYRLSKLHSQMLRAPVLILMTLIDFIWCCFSFLILLSGDWLSSDGLCIEAITLSLGIITILIARKYGSAWFGALSFLTFIPYISKNKNLVTGFTFLLKGQIREYAELNKYFTAYCDNSILNTVPYIFAGILILICIILIADIVNHNSITFYSIKQKRIGNLLQKTVTVLLAVIILLTSALLILIHNRKEVYTYCNSIYIIESDEKTDFYKYIDFEDEYNNNRIYSHYDVFDDYGDAHCDGEQINSDTCAYTHERKRYNEFIVYDTTTLYGEYTPTKKYVAVVPYNGYKHVYDNCKWYTAEDTDTISGVLDDYATPMSYYEVRLVK